MQALQAKFPSVLVEPFKQQMEEQHKQMEEQIKQMGEQNKQMEEQNRNSLHKGNRDLANSSVPTFNLTV